VPFAATNLVKLPDDLSDDQAILLSDIFPTGWFGADLAGIEPGRTVAVFGAGPVGQFAIASAMLMGAGRVFAIDTLPDRLEIARRQGAEAIDFNAEDPMEALKSLTGGIGVDRVIDAVGVDAESPHRGPAAQKADAQRQQFASEQQQVAPEAHPQGHQWQPGDAPSQALRWGVEALAKAGTLSIIGVYPPNAQSFPIGQAMNKNITIRMGNCNHRKYIPKLIELVRARAFDPQTLLTQQQELVSAIEAYQSFDTRQRGWLKVELIPPGGQGPGA
jgi:threonine dehydrogenase-like Zn-dependent dehydrogenase